MIIVDETLPVGDLPPPFPARAIEVKFDEDMRDSYDLKKEIGRGRFGTVYLCTCKKTGIKFAAKFVNTKRNQDRENVEREIEIMKALNDSEAHQKLIQLYDAYDMGKEMCLVLEVVQGGELFERVIDDDFELTERACAVFIRQICEGIEFIHSKNILHLDMKPENILCLSREGNRIKICDFGLARKYDPRKKLQVLFGTPEFVAPEVVNFEPISFGTDMWSIGVISYVLLSGLSPFMGHNYVETMTNVTHNKYDFDDETFDDVTDEGKDFIERLLLLDKCSRMTPEQCFRHPWLRQVSDPTRAKEAKERKERKELAKENLKKYMSRRRWNKAVHTVTALKRMGANLLPKNKPKNLSSTGTSTLSIPAPLSKSSSSPNLKLTLPADDIPGGSKVILESLNSPGSRNFQRCHSHVECSEPFSNDLLAKTMVYSRSHNQLDTLHEKYESYYVPPSAQKLSPIKEDSSNVINFSSSKAKTSNIKKEKKITDTNNNHNSQINDTKIQIGDKISNVLKEEKLSSKNFNNPNIKNKEHIENKSESKTENNRREENKDLISVKSESGFKESKTEAVTFFLGNSNSPPSSASCERSTIFSNEPLTTTSSNCSETSKDLNNQTNSILNVGVNLNQVNNKSELLMSKGEFSNVEKEPNSLNTQNPSDIKLPFEQKGLVSVNLRNLEREDASKSNCTTRDHEKNETQNSNDFGSSLRIPFVPSTTSKPPQSPACLNKTSINSPKSRNNQSLSKPNPLEQPGSDTRPIAALVKFAPLTTLKKSKTLVDFKSFGKNSFNEIFQMDSNAKLPKTSSCDLVDQLLSQFKSEKRVNFASLRPVKKIEKLALNEEPKRRIVKPYVCINRDGLPRNSGSVREMANRFTKRI